MAHKTASAKASGGPEPLVVTCTVRSLPNAKRAAAAVTALRQNPANRPPGQAVAMMSKALHIDPPSALTVMVSKYWGAKGVSLTVGFLDKTDAALKKRILAHMNAWGKTANVTFRASSSNPKVRISFDRPGYWSYLGTDILHIDAGEPTLNLQDFTMETPDSEFYRVVRHETGHTLGFPHEHMRKELVGRLDEEKCINYFGQTQGWSPDEVRHQVLTPLDDSSIIGTTEADPTSIMCYQIAGDLTKDGKPIAGGTDINKADYAFAGGLYPKPKKKGT
jgi:hypothetical protein